MTYKEIIRALRCCAEGECKDCAMHEDKQRCQENLLDKAADLIERMTADVADLRKELDWKDMVIALAQREQAKAEAENAALPVEVDAEAETVAFVLDFTDSDTPVQLMHVVPVE